MPSLGITATALPGISDLTSLLPGPRVLASIEVDLLITFIPQMVIFASLAVLLKNLLFDRVLKVFEEREKRTDGARAEARKMQEEAGELLRKYEAELDRVNRVAAEEREKVRAETAKLEAEILGEARAAVTKIVEHGRQRLEEETKEIQFELGKASNALAGEIASKVLGRDVA
ncbi:MAG: ATP synthase F0 subunit B [Polyangiaceae bacterium]